MRKATKLVLVPVVAMACIGGFADPAAANRANSRVEITKATGDTAQVQVRGKVTSGRDGCKNNRRVSVWHDVPPAGPSGNDFRIGKTKTDANGHWELSSPLLPDKVYAVVKKNRNCKSDTSPTEDVQFK